LPALIISQIVKWVKS